MENWFLTWLRRTFWVAEHKKAPRAFRRRGAGQPKVNHENKCIISQMNSDCKEVFL